MGELQVHVRIGGPLRDALGQRRAVTLPEGATVADLLAELGRAAGVQPGVLERVAVARGGAIVSPAQPLAAGDELSVVAPVAGG
jgi:sulfur carrier protein ThiS